MTTIYIIVASGGSYDDAWQSNVCARYSRDDAELEVLRLQEQSKKISAIVDEVRTTYYIALKAGAFTPEEIPRPPKGPAKSTKENRKLHAEEMQKYYALAQPIAKRNEARHIAAMAAAKEAAKQRAIELGADEDDLKVMGFDQPYFSLYCREGDASYDVEELEIT